MSAAKRSAFPLLKAKTIATMKEERKAHRHNKGAVRNYKSLGDAIGMKDMGIHLVRIDSGDLTTEFHTHYCNEEFIYILSGRGIAEIGSRKIEVGPGDFMGFVAQSLPHAMLNPYQEDLVYLLGGTRKRFDVTEYPRAQVRAYKFAGKRDSARFKHIREE